MTDQARPPDYAGPNVTGIVPGLLAETAPDWFPEPARDAAQVVLLVLDGLGERSRREHADILPVLGSMAGGPITTVLPATTSAALTSITTGLPPAVHGVTGYRVRVGPGVLNVLSWHWSGPPGAVPDPFELQRHAPFAGRPVPVVTRSEFRGSGFTDAHMRDAPLVGWHTIAELVEHVRRLVAGGEPLVYAYSPGIDTIAHLHGLHDGYYRAELAAADALVGALLGVLPERAALVVTADHGQVHLEPEDWIELPDLDPLVAVQAGDARFRHLYARDGARAALADAARDLVGDRAWVGTRREVLDAGWLGPDAHGSIAGRIGDVVLAARDPVAFVDPAYPRERRLRSAHGSWGADEVLVPLLAARGTGA